MVPIKEAITSGSWLQCEKRNNLFEANQFRIKVNSFRKLNLSEIDEPEEINDLENSAVLWLMNIEVVNLNKEPTKTHNNVYGLKLVDNDDFIFPVFLDGHLNCFSDFAKTSGLKRFYAGTILPKIKTLGSLVFQLPDDDDAEYFISLEDNGIVQEV
ncbi:hypothetical protein ESY86_10620 [Subsaximicrobium wynnwilliamsii]|uniref:DUF4352 domain-containing protein n=1 Tax=Subsaximicrobium wynnwilliamsii TaxID=291179 RepID=A0A5C6ZIA6_9FLAO|nr:hypothetical protein [Subsaximicrobium wynnwilliamsii]TXD84102.1 hypothetical protein ESY87_06220 [Subsaximicrobium wynnwilliamsii]TXD88940.1 hypothetical protein ESY86_10620 [Subsaximicrobium wynnwilliamsii]TXE03814.1 hypothetical protein ESY88_06215 [Subsaximicrobium wynnwilliamsii]